MASLEYANRAYVNKSSKKIPIYDPEKVIQNHRSYLSK